MWSITPLYVTTSWSHNLHTVHHNCNMSMTNMTKTFISLLHLWSKTKIQQQLNITVTESLKYEWWINITIQCWYNTEYIDHCDIDMAYATNILQATTHQLDQTTQYNNIYNCSCIVLRYNDISKKLYESQIQSTIPSFSASLLPLSYFTWI